MSYSRILNDVDVEGIRALIVNKNIFEAAPKIENTSLSAPITMYGDAYKNSRVFELRSSKMFVKRLVEKAGQGYDKQVCKDISRLYRVGLGLPQSKECHLLWEHLSSGYQPKVGDKVFSYSNMYHVLTQHWKMMNRKSIDPNWVYFSSHVEYFENLVRPTFATKSKNSFIEKRDPMGAIAKFDGLECTLIYRVDKLEGTASLYAAYALVKEKILNVTVQAVNCKNISNKLGPSASISSFGPYLLVSGTLTFKKRSLNKLKKYWGDETNINSANLIRQSLDQDIYSLAEFAGKDLPRTHPSVEFVERYRSKARKATRFIDSFSGSKVTRKQAKQLEKAQHLVDTFDRHKSVIDKARNQKQDLKEFDVSNHMLFVASDLYGYKDQDIKRISNPYIKVVEFLRSLNFVVAPLVKAASTVDKTITKLEAHAIPGLIVKGALYRLFDNQEKPKATNWIKVKRGN